jgi:triosephosphate isomerase
MRPIIVAGNWKMHTNPAEAADLASTIAARTRNVPVTQVFCPPFVCLTAMRDAVAGSHVEIGAQNIHHDVAGPYTGEVSARMLVGLATWVIVGHSERRRDQGETDQLIHAKLLRALEFGLRPILCVGEQLADRDAGRETQVVRTQLRGALRGIEPSRLLDAGLVIAYEPVWAIGTGRSASPVDAGAMSDWITRSISALGWAAGTAAEIPVLYGGSVTSANFGEFITEPGIDGALVGGASLKPDEMTAIVARAGVTAKARQAAAG